MNVLLIGLLAGAALLLCNREQHGIGAVRRNWYKEIAELQHNGVDLTLDYDQLDTRQKDAVKYVCNRSGYTTRSTRYSKPESFYRSCVSAYRKVAGSVGVINYPYETYNIRNQRGDVILTYNDYDEDRDFQRALSMLPSFGDDLIRTDTEAYCATIAFIAQGGKFVWKNKYAPGSKSKLLAGVEALFGGNSNGERKLYMGICATPERGGVYWEKFAERLNLDEDLRGGVEDAIRSCNSRKLAKDIIMDAYYKTFETPEYEDSGKDDEQIPF